MNISKFTLNPTLEVNQDTDGFWLSWTCSDGEPRKKRAENDELLAIKIVVEKLTLQHLHEENRISPLRTKKLLRRAVNKEILQAPSSKIVRDTSCFAKGIDISDEFIIADAFTIQWLITNACELHCKHCYDRSKRSPLTLT